MNFLQSSGGLSNIISCIESPGNIGKSVSNLNYSQPKTQISNICDLNNDLKVPILKLKDDNTVRDRIIRNGRYTTLKLYEKKTLLFRLPKIDGKKQTNFTNGENFKIEVLYDGDPEKITFKHLMNNNKELDKFYKNFIEG